MTKVEVYKNLHKNCWSIREAHGKVIKHADEVILKNCQFVVHPAGRAKVLREHRKNVHAFVRGELIDEFPKQFEGHCPSKVIYNPYQYDSFVHNYDRFEAVDHADCVEMINGDGVYAYWETT